MRLLTLCLLIPLSAGAETWVDIHLTSRHQDPTHIMEDGREVVLNEENFGLGVSHGITEHISLVAGGYRNSFDELSAYAGVDIHTSVSNGWRAGATVGYVSGYEEGSFAIIPNLVAPLTDNMRLRVGIVPIYNKTATFSLEVGF